MLHVVLVEPEIPANTGNIARTCAETGSVLHLVKPLGYDISDKAVKRAGLDYWHLVDVRVYEDLEDFFAKNQPSCMRLFSTKAPRRYDEAGYPDGAYLFFGKETKGLPEEFLAAHYDSCVRIPIRAEARSLNLSNSVAVGVFEALRQQAGEHHLSERQGELVEYLIGSLDDDGFLRKPLETIADELSFTHGIDVTAQELEEALHVLQQFEPRGIGARDLKECLRLQLTDPERQTPYTRLALAVVDRYFKDFADHHWDLVKQRLNIDDDTFEHVRHTLQHLNPRPAAAYEAGAAETAPTVVPDFYVTLDADGTPRVTLNGGDVPELHVSRAFRESIEQYADAKGTLTRSQKDAYVYARKKVEAAKSFLNLLDRRRVTLLTVMQAIAEMQQDFFKADDDETLLRPMTLREVAQRAGVDISTASRVTSSKYVQTVYGTYPLKFFFSQLFTGGDGEELSARKIKARLCELIAAEDKKHPLADEALAALLKQEGFPVARRTVAKYRDAAGLPPARLRKE